MYQVLFLEDTGEWFLMYQCSSYEEAYGYVQGRWGRVIHKHGVEKIFITFNTKILFSWKV